MKFSNFFVVERVKYMQFPMSPLIMHRNCCNSGNGFVYVRDESFLHADNFLCSGLDLSLGKWLTHPSS